MSPEQPSLAEYLVGTIGLRSAIKVLTFLVAWEIGRRELGDVDPSMTDYERYWKTSKAGAYRERALFLEAFPEETSPSRICDLLVAAWDERRLRRKAAAIALGNEPWSPS